MPSLHISALGAPEVLLNGEHIAVKPKKALALLIYLADAENGQARDTLATLLWPNSGQRQARAALRRRLSELTQTIGETWLSTFDDTVALVEHVDAGMDVARFEQYLFECQTHGHAPDEVCLQCRAPLEAAVTLYRDDFLAGFTLPDCPEFDDWQYFRAESLRGQLASALKRLVVLHTVNGEPETAIPYARRWTALDPLHEPAHRALMRAYAAAGQRATALHQFDLCVRALDVEMGAPPEAKTVQLSEAIRKGETPARVAAPNSPSPVETPDDRIAPAAARDEIRMVTVLALDVDAADEEEWDRRPDEVAHRIALLLQNAQRTLDRYEGFVTQLYDCGLQATFGIPALHEDDAERALYTALTLRDLARDRNLMVTAGASTGMVYASFGQRSEGPSISGRPVNLAVRLKGQAPVGSILADAQTYRQADQAFRFAQHGDSAPGRVESVSAYEAVRPRRHTAKSRGIGDLRAPLVGRKEELSRLIAAWQKARQGDGQFVTVLGEAGLGKSRLVAELKARVLDDSEADPAQTHLWLEGRCQEMTRSVPYGPFIDILQTSFGWTHRTPNRLRAQEVATALHDLVLQEQLTQDQVGIMGPILGQLLSLRFDMDWDERLKNARPEQIRHQTFETLRDYAVAVCRQQPLILVLEDLHWADVLSLELAIHFMEILPTTPILLVCVYRPEDAMEQDRIAQVAQRKCPANYADIRLRELPPDESRELVARLLRVEGLSAETRNRILDICRGNPFFVEEVLHDLIEANVVYRDGNLWRARKEVDSTPVPTRVQSVILSRYDRLPPDLKETLQLAAVAGRLFAEQMLAAAMNGNADVAAALRGLEERAFVYPERTAPQVVYSFRHVLAQEAVYRTIPGQRRAALHEKVGTALEELYAGEVEEVVDQLAYHFDRSDETNKAVSYLLRAGDRAARTYLTDEAVSHYHRALDRTQDLPDDEQAVAWRFHALSELGKTLMRSSRYEDAEGYLRQAIAWGKEHSLPVKEVVRLHWWLGDLLMNWNPRYEETLQTGLDGLAMLEETERETAEAAMMYGIIAFGYYFRQDEERFQAITSHLASFLPNLPHTEEFRVCYGCILDACRMRKDSDELSNWLDIATEQAKLHHDDWSLAEHTWVRAYTQWFRGGEPDEVMDTMRRAQTLFELVGDAKRVNWAEVGLGEIMGDYGLSSEAEVQLRKALRNARRLNEEHVRDIQLKLASACMAQRKWPEVRELLQDDLAKQRGREQNPADALVLLGFEALACGDRTLAAERFAEAMHAIGDPDSRVQSLNKWWLMIDSFFANALYGLESALDDAASFDAFCREFRAEHPVTKQAVFQYWYLEPSIAADLSSQRVEVDSFRQTLSEAWTWSDQHGGSEFIVDGGLTISSPEARGLRFPLLNAPRMMRTVKGDFVAQVTCQPPCEDRPGIGGLLLWQDKSNYLQLCIGVRAQDEVSLEGCVENQDVVIGRGRLVAEPVVLRMERIGGKLRALCSEDGENWLLVGEADLDSTPQEQIGLHAIGCVDRTIYHEPYPQGTAIHFTKFRFWN